MGTVLFYLLWPLIWFYAPLVVRGRAIVLVDGEVLVVKNWFGPGIWQLPGGGLKFGEKPLDAIHRELSEELGIQSIEGELLLDEPVTIRSRGLLLRQMYAVYRLDTKPSVTLSKELTAHDWIAVADSPVPEQIQKLLV